jgi:glycosyltransferase involved in cell wall biosynthesis
MLITVSQFSRDELIDVLQAPPARIRVIPEGVDERFAVGADPAGVAARYGLARPYVLVVAKASQRKNLAAIECAATALDGRGIDLVAAGSGRSYLRAGSWSPRRLGYVADEDLPGLYAGARALAMPSIYEGFGLPCLEAMACGTPVVAAAAGALPETVADAALLVDPRDQDGFAQALLVAACEQEVRERLIAAGRSQVRRFTWKRTAEETDAAIGELLGQR